MNEALATATDSMLVDAPLVVKAVIWFDKVVIYAEKAVSGLIHEHWWLS